MLHTFVEMIKAMGVYLCSLPKITYELYTMPKSIAGWVFLGIFTVLWASILIGSFIQAVAPLFR